MSLPEPKRDEAEVLFKKAIEKGIPKANSVLGSLYFLEENHVQGVKYLKAGVARKEAEAAYFLAIYNEDKNWGKAEKLFLWSYDWGEKRALARLLDSAFLHSKNDRREFILEQFEKNKEIVIEEGPLMMVKFAKLLLWNGKIEESINGLASDEQRIANILQADNQFTEQVVDELTDYFMLLIAKGQYSAALSLFSKETPDYKQILRPVYFALMNYMKDEYPQEYLKAGEELKETVDEIVKKIADYRVKYK